MHALILWVYRGKRIFHIWRSVRDFVISIKLNIRVVMIEFINSFWHTLETGEELECTIGFAFKVPQESAFSKKGR